MNRIVKQTACPNKKVYQEPSFAILEIYEKDILTASIGDTFGEWDPQLIDEEF